MKVNHKAKYKYNYFILKREMMYVKTQLKDAAMDLEGMPAKNCLRLAKDLEKAVLETESNFSQPKYVP
jgi:hypothetical protein